MALSIPISAVILVAVTSVRSRVLTSSDARVKAVSELLNGMRTIKLEGWETAFQKKVEELRAQEVEAITAKVLWSRLPTFPKTHDTRYMIHERNKGWRCSQIRSVARFSDCYFLISHP